MNMDEYVEAKRLGERAYREALGKGVYPYLPVLQEIINHVTIVSELPLGEKEIPADLIVGTYSAGRRTAFAPDFMPLLSRNSEFAGKWQKVCDYHLTKGIHDPIRVYEYMNRYYVMEGNKRVSVLKFYGAASIPGNVTRLIPARSETKANRAYYEYLDFYKQYPENYLFFTEPAAYDELRACLGIGRTEILKDEQCQSLRSLFVRFEQAYAALGGKALTNMTTGDALLTYIRFYGYRESLSSVPMEIRGNLEKIWTEIELQNISDSVALVMDDDTRKSVFGRLLSGTGSRRLKVAFIYAKNAKTSSWVYGHELGRAHIEEVFGDEIESIVYEDVDPLEGIDDTLKDAIAQGADVIFATSPRFLYGSLRAAARYPDTRILVCTLNSTHRLVRTYFARSYEAKFVLGIIAGAMVKEHDIGYISDYPTVAGIANLNAFALGVRMIHPDARVHVQWFGVAGNDPMAYFREHGIRMISMRDLTNLSDPEREFGLIEMNPDGTHERLAMPVWDWGVLYQKLLESIRDGSFQDVEKAAGNRALNYWWGMDSDAIDVFVSQKVPGETVRLVDFIKNALRDRTLRPFQGVIRAKDRVILSSEEDELSPQDITQMDWLLDNIVGSLPSMDELTEEGKDFVMLFERTEQDQDEEQE